MDVKTFLQFIEATFAALAYGQVPSLIALGVMLLATSAVLTIIIARGSK